MFVFAGVIGLGTLGFHWIEGWDLGRALFFTVITITTVGYGDEGLSEPGRHFALLLLLGGVGAATHAFTTLVEAAIHRPPRWRRRMEAQIERLEDHVIVCGYGRMGEAVCERLGDAGRALVVIESRPEAVADALSRGALVVDGCATEDEVLARAGIARASALVSAVDSEMENLAITLSARELRPQLPIVARAESDGEARKLRRAGATRTVSPFRSGGVEAVDALLAATGATDATGADGAGAGRPGPARCGDLVLSEVSVEEGGALAGVRLDELARGAGAGLCFVALDRPGKDVALSPDAGRELAPGDRLVVAGPPHAVGALRAWGEAVG